MDTKAMGRVAVAAKIENLKDVMYAQAGDLADRVRAVEVKDALVDTGATMLAMPKRLIEQLGLQRQRSRNARTATGTIETGIYDPVRLTIMDRDCIVQVAEVADECPVLIGQVPLELLDFVVDPTGQRLIGNPAHGGEQMYEMY